MSHLIMSRLIWTLVAMVVAGGVGYFLSAMAVMVALLPTLAATKIPAGKLQSCSIFVALGITGILQAAWWTEWAALCAYLAYLGTVNTPLFWHWVCYLFWFGESVAIIGAFAAGESQGSTSDPRKTWGTLGYTLIAVLAYIVFAIYPVLAWHILPHLFQSPQ